MKKSPESTGGQGRGNTVREQTHPLSHGRTLSIGVDPTSVDHIVVSSITGEMELSIELGPDGPKLRVRAVDIELVAAKRLSMRCESFLLQAERSAELLVDGPIRMRGEDVYLEAPAGELALTANDDVAIRGERILLNSDAPPMPSSSNELRSRADGKRGR